MPKKLTVLGALVAVVLGAMGLWRESTPSADAAIQVFNPDVTICYGGAYPDATAVAFGTCNGGSATAIPSGAGAPVPSFTIISLPEGSRLTLPVTFTPNAFGIDPNGSANPGTTGCYDDDDDVLPSTEPIACAVGDVSSRTDLLCDDLQDILADVASPKLNPWPDDEDWIPFSFGHLYDTANGGGLAGDPRNGYVLQISPAPSSYGFVSLEKAPLHNLFFGGAGAFPLNPPTPLQLLTQQGPGFRVSSALLAGNPQNPPDTQMLCLDSPQDSVTQNDQLLAPVDGIYPRWVLLQSAADITDGTTDRILDWECIAVGAGAPDADGDCSPDAVDANDANPDQDSDLVPDGIEDVYGSDPTAKGNNANPSASESPNDDVDDFDEIFGGTNPDSNDTDGDGSEDKQDNGSDENGATAGFVDSTDDDNCPGDAGSEDGGQNADSEDDLTGTPPPDGQKDITNPNEDVQGDDCDADDDNDGITDVAEPQLHIKTVGVPAANVSFCTNATGTGTPVLNPTTNDDFDTDDDLGYDGRECVFDSNPKSSANSGGGRMAANSGVDSDQLSEGGGSGGSLGVGGETFFRTEKISQQSGTPDINPDNDTTNTGGCIGGDVQTGGGAGKCDADSDNDGLQDGVEVKFYATDPSDPDTDGDGCRDGTEAASINNDRTVGSTDLGQTAQRFGSYRDAGTGAITSQVKQNYDYTKDGSIGSGDLGQVAQRFGSCTSSFETGPSIAGRTTQS